MGRKKVITHVILLLSTVGFVFCSKILYYHDIDQPPEQLQCSTVEFKEQPGCVCLNGLWKLKSNCTTYAITAADSYCFSPETEISHAIEIVPNNESIAILSKDDRVVQLSLPLHKGGVEIKASDFVVTGTPYTVTGVFGVTCLYPQDEAYCYFNPMDVIGSKIISVSKGCDPETPMDVPSRCAFIKGPKVCLFERSLLSKERKVKEGITIHSLAASAPSHVWLGDPSRTKRESNWASSNYRGRTFFGVPGQEFEVVQGVVNGTNFSNYDEDLEADDKDSGTTVKEEILNEVWNYIDFHLQVILGIKSNADQEIDYGLPYFKLLHLSKKVMKKICPTDYVPHSYLDLSVNAFIQVLMKRVFYEAPTTNLPGFTRIVNALETCIESAKPFPFLTREKATPPTEAPTTEQTTSKPGRQKRQGMGDGSTASGGTQNGRDANSNGNQADDEVPTSDTGASSEAPATGATTDSPGNGVTNGDTNGTTNGVSSEPPKDWDVKCPSGPLRDGRFKFLEGVLQLNVTESFVGLKKDPIIETVWKIFWSTVNACFHHFEGKKSTFNDHHRFIAWMIVLFENSIVETWKAGRAEKSTFGGLLGNMEETMRSLAYCAASTRFPINYNQTKYPWELTRPFEGDGTDETTAGSENPEEGTGGTGAPGSGPSTDTTPAPEGETEGTTGSATSEPPASNRRKRRLSMPKITCADNHHFSQCTNTAFTKTKANSDSKSSSVTKPRKILYSQNGL